MSAGHSYCDDLIACLRDYRSCVVAFSGGVDSAVVAKAAVLALGERALAVTGDSLSLAAGELDAARQAAEQIGIAHTVLATEEMADARYVMNAADRCYHCKAELYGKLSSFARRSGYAVVASGANADDVHDYRPGLVAANEQDVRHPLAELGIHKRDVRALARAWQLTVWNKPAMPCLSSRIAYGQEVTPERLQMIDAAEQFLRRLGLDDIRVRYHGGDLARIEVSPAMIERLADRQTREQLVRALRDAGFRYVTLDLEGFRSGSMNAVLPVENLKRYD